MRNVAGRSDDGVVEAIEDTDRDFVVGVQWHAERLVDDPTHRCSRRWWTPRDCSTA